MKASKLIFLGLLLYSTVYNPLSAQNPDISIFRAINNRHSPATDKFFTFQSNSVKPLYIATPTGILGYGIISGNRKAEDIGTIMAVAGLLNFGLTYSAKIIINRKRPYERLDNVHLPAGKEGTKSFPSGHTSSAFTLATMMALNYPQWYVVVPAFTWAGLAAYSRMALGVHYPSDVLAGAIIGTGVGLLIHHYRHSIIRQKNRAFH